MSSSEIEPIAQTGDLVQLISARRKVFTFRLQPGDQLQTHRGIINHDDLIGLPWGSQVYTHIGSPFFLFQPVLGQIITETRRNTQIMYPKDIGFILVTMGIGPGQHVLEAGTGSGALTTAFAHAVGQEGRVTSYEVRQGLQQLAKKNIDRLNLGQQVVFKMRDIAEGFEERGVDAVFLDLPNPYDYLPQVYKALKSGGYFGSILPTVNQVTLLLPALYQSHFAVTEVCEILLRYYKPVHQRLRPTDRMVAHTGYLIFSRSVIPADPPSEE
jgi:tRNA (adenine57-N1/adenine58-N1)-methyltransferase